MNLNEGNKKAVTAGTSTRGKVKAEVPDKFLKLIVYPASALVLIFWIISEITSTSEKKEGGQEASVSEGASATETPSGEGTDSSSFIETITTSSLWQTLQESLGGGLTSTLILGSFLLLIAIYILKALYTTVRNFTRDKEDRREIFSIGAAWWILFIPLIVLGFTIAIMNDDDKHEKLMLPVTVDLTHMKDGDSETVSMNITQVLELIRPTQKMSQDNQVLWECIEVVKPSKEDLKGVLAGFTSVSGEGQNFPRLKLTKTSFDLFMERGTPWIDVKIRRVKGSIYNSPCSD